MIQRWRRLRLWLWLLFGAMLLFYLQKLPIGQKLDLALAPVLEASQVPGEWWNELKLWFNDRQGLQDENRQLRQRLQSQAPNIQSINSLREENRQLRSLLHLRPLTGFQWQAAKVVARSLDKMSRHLIIKIRNAKPDYVVASSEGLVGLVDSVEPEYAIVRTILDASLSVPVTIKGHNLAALVRGQGNSLKIEFLSLSKAPEVGSILITSGAGGVLPAGIPVARITRIVPRKGEIFADIEAEVLAHWRRDAWLAIAVTQPP